MNWFINWLSREVKGFKVVCFIFLVLFIDFLYSFVFWIVAVFLDVLPDSLSSGHGIPILAWSFPFTLFGWAFLEELIFRVVPLTVACVYVADESDKLKWIVVGIAIVSSIIFGFLHGGTIHIFIQGVGGFLYCIVFLKCGGFRLAYIDIFDGFKPDWTTNMADVNKAIKKHGWKIRKKIIKATLCCTTVHFLFNGSLAICIFIQGGTTF